MGCPWSRCWQIQCLVWGCLLFHSQLSSRCPRIVEGVRFLSEVSYNKGTDPFMSALPLWPNHLSKVSFPKPSHWGLEFNMWLWENTNIQSVAISVQSPCLFNCLLVSLVASSSIYSFSLTHLEFSCMQIYLNPICQCSIQISCSHKLLRVFQSLSSIFSFWAIHNILS